jgi:hypothetical protein
MSVDNRQQFRGHRVGVPHALRVDTADDSAPELLGVLLEEFALAFGTSSRCSTSGARFNDARFL